MPEDFDQEDPKDPLGILTKPKQNGKADPLGILKKKEVFNSDPNAYLKLFGVGAGPSFPVESKSPSQNGISQSDIGNTLTTGFTSTDSRVGGDVGNSTNAAKTVAGVYNTLVGSAASIVGGLGEIIQKKEPTLMFLPDGTVRKQSTELVEKLRSSVSTKEEEAKRSEFDVHKKSLGENIKALAFSAPSMIADVMAGTASGGATFFAQGVNNAAEEIESNPLTKDLPEGVKLGYTYTSGFVNAALMRLNFGFVLKESGVDKLIARNITNKIITEFAEQGVRATQEVIDKAVTKEVASLSANVERFGLKTAIGAATGAGTGAVMGASHAGLQVLVNTEEGKEVFDTKDIGEHILNQTASLSLFSALTGGASSLKSNLNHISKVKENVAHLPEKSQVAFVTESLTEKLANEKAEKLTDPTLIKEQKEIAKEAHEIKTEILKGKDPDEIVTEKQQKEIDEKEKTAIELKRLEEDHKINLQKIDDKIEDTDGRESKANRTKLKGLNLEKERLKEDYEKKVAKLKPTTDETTPIPKGSEPNQQGELKTETKVEPIKPTTEAIKGTEEKEVTFKTSKGSVYTIHEDGTTTRNKSYHAEHGGDEGIKPRSQRTVYVDTKDAKKMSLMQTDGWEEGAYPHIAFDEPNKKVAVAIKGGRHHNTYDQNSLIDYSDKPEVGKTPIEIWDDGKVAHFGNEITEIYEPSTPKPSTQGGVEGKAKEKDIVSWTDNNGHKSEGEVVRVRKLPNNNKGGYEYWVQGKEGGQVMKYEVEIKLEKKGGVEGEGVAATEKQNQGTGPSTERRNEDAQGTDADKQKNSDNPEKVTPSEEVTPPPPEPPKAEATEGEGEKPAKNKALATRLVESKNIPEEARKGIESGGLKYEPKSQKEAEDIAKSVIDEAGMDEAVLQAQAGKFGGDVNTLIQTESLNRLAELSEKETDPTKKLEHDKKFAEIAMQLDEWLRDKAGRGVAAVNYFYKKSPLGITMVENAKRKQDFEQWAKPKDKSWGEFFNEMMKEPEFKDIVTEKVKEELKKERATSRKERIRKVDEFFDKAKKDIDKGDVAYSTIIPPKLLKAALDGMQKAYHAGEKVAELIQTAIDEISAAMGKAPWDKDKFRKEWEEKLKEKTEKKPLTDEELKARILDKFRKKLKGLSEKQKDDVIRQAHKQLIENGALEYEDFKKIIARVLGRGELTIEEANRMKELVAKTNELEVAAKRAREERTPEAFKKYRESQLTTARAVRDLNEMFLNKVDIVKRLTGIMQLNTLGLASLINNPIYNIANQMGVRFPVGALNDVADRAISLMSSTHEREYNVFETQKEFWEMLGVGAKESATQLKTGLNRADYTQKELYSEQIRPFKSIRDLISFARGKKQLTRKQVIDKALQGTAGIPAEAVARVLNIGDKPQRFAAEGAQASAFSKALGLKDMDKTLFMEFPREEAYRAYKAQGLSDAKAGEKADYIRDVIIKEGQRSTFQQDNLLNDALTRFFGVFGGKESGTANLLKSLTISPYIKIPSNAFWSMYNLLNPEVAILQSMAHGGYSKVLSGKGETNKSKLQLREARYWLAHAVVGMATRAVVIALVQQGLFTPSSDKDDPKKVRDATNYFDRAGTMKMGDMQVSTRWLGQWGMLANQIAKQHQDATPEQREKMDEFWHTVLGGMEVDGLQELQNGVFGNSSTLLQALGTKNPDRYLMNTLNLFTNIIQPATAAQFERATLNEVPSSNGDSFLEKVNQNFAQRSIAYRKLFHVEINNKRTIWGQVQPKGGNILSRMFGVSKADPQLFARPLYEKFLETGDSSYLPPAVLPTLNDKKLPQKQYDRLQEYVGEERQKLVEPYINDMSVIEGVGKKYSEIKDDETKKKVLAFLYDYGRLLGLQKFYSDFPQSAPKKLTDAQEEIKKEIDANLQEFRDEVKAQKPIEPDQ